MSNREFILYDTNAPTEEEKIERSHYVYVCEKEEGADAQSALYYDDCLAQLMIESEAVEDQ